MSRHPLPVPAHNAKTYARLYNYVAAKCLTPGDVLEAFLSQIDLITRTPTSELVGPYREDSWPTYAWRHRQRLMSLLRPPANGATTAGIKARYDEHWSEDDVRRGRKRLRDYVVGGRLYRMPELAFTPPLVQFLAGLCTRYIRPDDRVIEFGCGIGRNVLMLRRLFPGLRCMGFDQSPAGVAACRDLATRFKLTDLEFGVLDLTDAESFASATSAIQPGAVLMTIGCLECVPGTEAVVERLLGLRPRLVLHFEPIIELHRAAFLSRDYFTRRHLTRIGYMNSLLSTVQALQRDGRAQILECARSGYGKALVEYSTLVWSPASTP